MWKGSDIGKAKVAAAGAAGRPAAQSAQRRAVRWAAVVAVCAILAAGLALWLWPRGGGSAVRQGSGTGGVRRPETHPAPATTAAPAPKAAPADASAPTRPAPAVTAPARTYRGVEVVSSSSVTNLDGAVVERLVLADGRTVKAVRLPEPVFRRPCDQLIAMALSAAPGEAVPPLPAGPDAEASFLASMDEPVEALETDPPGVRELKARVEAARRGIAEAVRAGGSFRQALAEHAAEAGRIAQRRLDAAMAVREVMAEGGADEARAFAERANELLGADGVPPVPVPGEGRRRGE